jgi:hypothetical protein
MTGRLGKVSHCERTIKGDDGTPVVNVFVELGDDGHPETVTAELLAEPGVDALPLPGDEAMIEEAEGQGETSINAFADPKNAGKAEPGERRIYARDLAARSSSRSGSRATGADLSSTRRASSRSWRMGRSTTTTARSPATRRATPPSRAR